MASWKRNLPQGCPKTRQPGSERKPRSLHERHVGVWAWKGHYLERHCSRYHHVILGFRCNFGLIRHNDRWTHHWLVVMWPQSWRFPSRVVFHHRFDVIALNLSVITILRRSAFRNSRSLSLRLLSLGLFLLLRGRILNVRVVAEGALVAVRTSPLRVKAAALAVALPMAHRTDGWSRNVWSVFWGYDPGDCCDISGLRASIAAGMVLRLSRCKGLKPPRCLR
mmetsp:Transcript_52123/g.110928  ORF Transcript_52123/g.110928 Transcript_52123/m.110928 type:complete len:222 (-) Transcript_52123:172-837(-)